VRQPAEHKGDRHRPQPRLRTTGKLDQAEQDQEQRRIFDEIGMCAHACFQHCIATVADRHLVAHAQPAHPDAQPQVEQRRGSGDGERDRQRIQASLLSPCPPLLRRDLPRRNPAPRSGFSGGLACACVNTSFTTSAYIAKRPGMPILGIKG
jgi:hypothetical protein